MLVLDVARFKHPPHWVAIESLAAATLCRDPDSDKARGFLRATRSQEALPEVPAVQFERLFSALHAVMTKWHARVSIQPMEDEKEIVTNVVKLFQEELGGSVEAAGELLTIHDP